MADDNAVNRERAQAAAQDLILTDRQLPAMEGLAATWAIRAKLKT